MSSFNAKTPISILLLEDNQLDVELIAVELKKLGSRVQLEAVQSEAEFRQALESRPPDLILSDHGLPSFDGFRALEMVRRDRPELPFIFLTGSNDQGMIARMRECGATDYVFKNELSSLCPAIQRALS